MAARAGISSTVQMMRKTATMRDGQTAGSPEARPQILEWIDHAIIAVQTEWNGWRAACVRAADLEDVHWAQPPGARQPLVHGAIWCNRLHSGQLPHNCELTTAPHRLLVWVLKSHTSAPVFAELSKRADAAVGGFPCPGPASARCN
jgi:hypothetical protein